MQNVQIVRKGNIVTLTIDVSKSYGPSKSGKTEMIASTQGNVRIEGSEGLSLGVNLWKPLVAKQG